MTPKISKIPEIPKEAKIVYLKSGQLFFGNSNDCIVTTLGTCVAVCIYDRRLHSGGMVHFLLPDPTCAPDHFDNKLNFGIYAIPALLRCFKEAGSLPSDLDVKILGGCWGPETVNDTAVEVAKKNIDCAEVQMKKYGLSIAQRKTGLNPPMLVKFETASGLVYLSKRRDVTGVVAGHTLASVDSANQRDLRHRPIRVLIVDDSASMQKILKATLGQFEELAIVGVAASAHEAEVIRKKTSPDVMTLDIHMPDKDGVTYLSELMKFTPMPVIMVSDLSIKEASPVMKALEIGAFDYVQKPALSEMGEIGQRIRDLVVAAFQSKERKADRRFIKSNKHLCERKSQAQTQSKNFDDHPELICLGASTGGTEALREVFADLPGKTPPIVVVQHMPAAFTKPFALSLNRVSKIEVKEAENGDVLECSKAYVAPGGQQLRIVEAKKGILTIQLTDDLPVNRFKPSVDVLFLSVAKLPISKKTTAALLTGMGDDGARGLLQLRKSGAMTVAQSQESCVVYGMPKAAAERDAAVMIADLEAISVILMDSKNRKIA